MCQDIELICDPASIFRPKKVRKRRNYSYRFRNRPCKKSKIQRLSPPIQPELMECQVDCGIVDVTPMIPKRSQSQTLSTNVSESEGNQNRRITLTVVQQICSDEFLSRDTCALAGHYVDQFIKATHNQFEETQDHDLNILIAATIGLAVRMNQSIGVSNRKLATIAQVEAQDIQKIQLKIMKMLGFKMHSQTYSSLLNETLFKWDSSSLNEHRQCYFTDDEASYQRYRNICANIDEEYLEGSFEDCWKMVSIAILESLGDTTLVRQFLGYSGQPVKKKKQFKYERHSESIYKTNYMEWVRLQVHTD